MREQLYEQCCHIVRRVLAQRGWGLVQNEAAFVEDVISEVQNRLQHVSPAQYNRRPQEKIIEDATVNRYGHIWHAACGADGTLRQWRAFKELQAYLYPIALYHAHHDRYVAEESTQEALINTWQHLGQVRDPGSFARWAGTIVSREARRRLEERARKGREISQVDLLRSGEAEDTEPKLRKIVDRSDPFPASQKPRIAGEIRTRVEAVIRHCLRRSKQQQVVMIDYFLNQKGFKEVADELGKTPQNTYVLKTRALARLRRCKEFLETLEELM